MKTLKGSVLTALFVFLVGCGGADVEVIDLNRVLDVMVSTLNRVEAPMASGETADAASKDKFMQEFNVAYQEDLNKAKLIKGTITTEVNTDGSITGSSGGKKLFKVEIDEARSRLIATDLQYGYHRDHGFSMAGLAAGMLIGHLLSRQRGAGINSSRFANMKMSPANYHKNAVAKAKASARAKSGSGSFSKGK